MPRTVLPAAALLLVPALAAHAQTGPFADGELVVHNLVPSTGETVLYRVDPTTGSGAELLGDLYTGYAGADWLEYDPYRDGLIGYFSRFPTHFSPQLHFLRPDGTLAQLGLYGMQVTGMAPAGDGRVYLRRGTDRALFVLTAAGQLAPVLDAAGTAQATTWAEHLAYDAALNALVGVAHSQAPTACGPSAFELTGHRLDLSADGSRVVAESCAAYDFGTAASPVGLDPIGNGQYLITISDGWAPWKDQLLAYAPATGTIGLFSQSDWSDIDGGVWSQTLGQAVLLEDGQNTLRKYSQGQGGQGTLLATNVLVPDVSTGTTTHNKLLDIESSGPACAGTATVYGAGLAGWSSKVPALGAAACPAVGRVLSLAVTNARPDAVGLVVLGAAPAAIPLYGGTLHVAPPFAKSIPFTTTSFQGSAGWGSAAAEIPADPTLSGLPIHAQAGVLDSFAPQDVALSPGLALTIG